MVQLSLRDRLHAHGARPRGGPGAARRADRSPAHRGPARSADRMPDGEPQTAGRPAPRLHARRSSPTSPTTTSPGSGRRTSSAARPCVRGISLLDFVRVHNLALADVLPTARTVRRGLRPRGGRLGVPPRGPGLLRDGPARLHGDRRRVAEPGRRRSRLARRAASSRPAPGVIGVPTLDRRAGTPLRKVAVDGADATRRVRGGVVVEPEAGRAARPSSPWPVSSTSPRSWCCGTS